MSNLMAFTLETSELLISLYEEGAPKTSVICMAAKRRVAEPSMIPALGRSKRE